MSFELSNVKPLLNDFIRSRQHVGRNRQTDLLGGLQSDNKLKLTRLLDRQSAGFLPSQIFVHL
jgi:hypothetical protein